MSRRRHRIFSASLVVTTVAFAPGCDKQSSDRKPEEMTRNPPPLRIDAGVAAAQPDAAAGPSGPITFDGYGCLQGPEGKQSSVPCPQDLLPVAAKGTAVHVYHQVCRTLERKQVRCPATIALPDPRDTVKDKVHVGIDEGTFGCHTWTDYTCHPSATCNPPVPTPVACPDALLPTLLPGVAPTSRKGGECFLGTVEVVCPTGDLSGPRLTRVEDPEGSIFFRQGTQDCEIHYRANCDPGVKCNPPPPEEVRCPDDLLPALVNGKEPTKKADGTCWSGTTRVQC